MNKPGFLYAMVLKHTQMNLEVENLLATLPNRVLQRQNVCVCVCGGVVRIMLKNNLNKTQNNHKCL